MLALLEPEDLVSNLSPMDSFGTICQKEKYSEAISHDEETSMPRR